MRYTDPTGHTISDVEEGIETLGGLIVALVLVGETTLQLLPILLMGGPIALVIALVLFILILTIVALIFHVLNEILDLTSDEFDHFESDRPTDDIASTDPSGLPQEPDSECPSSGPLEFLQELNGGHRNASDFVWPCMQEAFNCPKGAAMEGMSGFFEGLTWPWERTDNAFAANLEFVALVAVVLGAHSVWVGSGGTAAVLFGNALGIGVFVAIAKCKDAGVLTVECVKSAALAASGYRGLRLAGLTIRDALQKAGTKSALFILAGCRPSD